MLGIHRALIVVSASSCALAQEMSELERPEDPWRLSVAPYAWLTSFSGNTTMRGIDFDADNTFIELVEDSQRVIGLMGAVDLEYRRLVFQFNGSFAAAEFEDGRGIFRNGSVSADVDIAATWVELFGGYRFVDAMPDAENRSLRLTLDGFVGMRSTFLDTEANVTATTDVTLPDGTMLNFGASHELNASEEWLEPFVGGRVGLSLTKNWLLALRADVGGFGVSGSDFSWQVAAVAGYRWHFDGWQLGLFGGYRALGQDYSSGDFGWDVVTHGPLLGAQFRFTF